VGTTGKKPGGWQARFARVQEPKVPVLGEGTAPPVRAWVQMTEAEKEKIRMAYTPTSQKERAEAARDRRLLLAEWRGRRAEWRQSKGETLGEWDLRLIAEGLGAERELQRLGVRMRYT